LHDSRVSRPGITRDELIRRLRRIAKKRGVAFDVIASRGKGGHWTVQFGDAHLPVPQAHRGDLAAGTLRAILRRFGLRLEDLE
jgi:mRNA interferase HicA